MNQFLEKRVAKFTLDVSGAVSSYVTGELGGSFAAADFDGDKIIISGHGFETGDYVGLYVDGGGTASTTPDVGTGYYIIKVDNNTVSLASSLSNAKDGTAVSLTAGSADDCYLVPAITGTINSDENGGPVIPKGSVITDAWYSVDTTFESDDAGVGDGNADDATIALGIESSGDLVSAASISTGASAGTAGDLFDSGQHGTLAGSPSLDDGETEVSDIGDQTASVFGDKRAENFIKTTDNQPIEVKVANDAYLHEGKMEIYVEFVG